MIKHITNEASVFNFKHSDRKEAVFFDTVRDLPAEPYSPFNLKGDIWLEEIPQSGFIVLEGNATINTRSCFEGTIVVTGDLELCGGFFDGTVYASGLVSISGRVSISGTLHALGGLRIPDTGRLEMDGRLWTPGAAMANISESGPLSRLNYNR